MATSADDVVLTKLEDMVQCAICLEQLEDPRCLLCQHSFCTKCLQGMLGTAQKIRCPCCNKDTPIPNGIRGLPVDFRTNTQLEILSRYKSRAPKGTEVVAVKEDRSGLAELVNTFQLIPVDARCPVCEEIPTVSKNLSCGHHLCENCVQFLLPVGGDSLHCPTCSCETRILNQEERSTGRHTSPRADQSENVHGESRLTFHPRCGQNIVVHTNQLTVHRDNPLNTSQYAIVLTSRHLRPDELFEVQLDRKVNKWIWSLKIGVTTQTPTAGDFPEKLFDLSSDKWFMSSDKVYHNARKVLKTYYRRLDSLTVGDRVGVQRRLNGDLHFHVNGDDLGVAVCNVPAAVYGVVDLAFDAVQVTIVNTTGP